MACLQDKGFSIFLDKRTDKFDWTLLVGIVMILIGLFLVLHFAQYDITVSSDPLVDRLLQEMGESPRSSRIDVEGKRTVKIVGLVIGVALLMLGGFLTFADLRYKRWGSRSSS